MMQPLSLGLLTMSIILAIFTLALVPLLAEQVNGLSIYETPIRFHLLKREVTMYLTQVCRPQHTTFILGILAYAVGAADVHWGIWSVAVVMLSIVVVFLHGSLSAPAGAGWPKRSSRQSAIRQAHKSR